MYDREGGGHYKLVQSHCGHCCCGETFWPVVTQPLSDTIVSDHLQFRSWQYIGWPKWDVARNKNLLFGLGNNQSMLCHDMRFKWTEHNKVERWFDHPCPIIGRFRFPRVRGFWTHDITSPCAIWRHAFKMKFRRWKQTWEQAFSSWPLNCGHDATFRHSCSGKRLSKRPLYTAFPWQQDEGTWLPTVKPSIILTDCFHWLWPQVFGGWVGL